MIVYLPTGQKYIGKKHYRGAGRLNKGKESNWKVYTSSSTTVQELIRKEGKDKFAFIILEEYRTMGGLSFAETWSQIVAETPANNHEFFNRFIDKVTWRVTEPVTVRHKRRLTYYLRKYPYAVT